MVYLCKSYLENGQVDQYILFESLSDSMTWATKNARVVPTKNGWDTRYNVAIYDVQFGLPFDPFHPGPPIKVINPN